MIMTESLPPAPAGDILAWLALASTRSTSAATLAAPDARHQLRQAGDIIRYLRIATDY